MRCAREIRAEGWRRLWTDKWFGKVLFALILLGIVVQGALHLVQALYAGFDVIDVGTYLQQVREAKMAGGIVPVPVRETWIRMIVASGFYAFIAVVFASCAQFGRCVILLKAARDEREGWMSGVFGGFRIPFGLFWQSLLTGLLVLLWSLLLIFPGIVAAFRYSQAFYVRSEHPDWGALRCLRESGRLTDGNKWRLFRFNLSYLGYVLVAVAPLLAAAVIAPACFAGGAGGKVVGVLLLLTLAVCFLAAAAVVSTAIAVGRAVFYRDLVAERPYETASAGSGEVAA